jgi:hypothetical protein
MKLKKDIQVSNNIFIRILAAALAAVGLFSPWLFRGWMPKTSPEIYPEYALIIAAVIGIVLGIYAHEFYRHLMAKLLGFESTVSRSPFYKSIVTDYLSKWQAVAVIIAPFTDLTLISMLLLVLSNSWLFVTFTITFMTINFMLSARDLYITFNILLSTDKYDIVKLTKDGFQIWIIDN